MSEPHLFTGKIALKLSEENQKLHTENKQLRRWVNDLQSGMYINCVYCGHRYGPQADTPQSMADILKQHIEQCPKHPASALKAEIERLRAQLDEVRQAAEVGLENVRILAAETDGESRET